MQAPRWLGECGNYLGYVQAGSGIMSLDEFSRRYNIPLSSRTVNGGTTTYVPPPITTVPTTREPTTRPTTQVEIPATVTTYVPPPSTVPQYIPPEQAAPLPEPLWQTQMPAQYGGGGVQVVTQEKEKLPGWVVPALIAAATMLFGGGGS